MNTTLIGSDPGQDDAAIVAGRLIKGVFRTNAVASWTRKQGQGHWGWLVKTWTRGTGIRPDLFCKTFAGAVVHACSVLAGSAWGSDPPHTPSGGNAWSPEAPRWSGGGNWQS